MTEPRDGEERAQTAPLRIVGPGDGPTGETDPGSLILTPEAGGGPTG
jgi:hypothetical protein